MRKVITRLLPCLMMSITLFSCAGWQKATSDVLATAKNSSKYFWQIAYNQVKGVCIAEAKDCVKNGVESLQDCPRAAQCLEGLSDLGNWIKRLDALIFASQRAVELGREDRAGRIADEVLTTIAQIQVLLRNLGVLDVG